MRKVEAMLWHKPNSKKLLPIKVRYWEGTYKYINLNIFLTSDKFFNKKTGQVRASHPEHEKYNDIIKNAVKKYSAEHSSGESFKKYLKQHYDNLLKIGKIGNGKKFQVLYNHLNNFRPQDIKFTDLDIVFLRNFHDFLRNNELNDNTIQIYLNKFKRTYYMARQDKLVVGDNIFEYYKFYGSTTYSKSMSPKEFHAFKNAVLFSSDYIRIRDYNMMLFYLNGIRVGDALLLKFKNINGEYITYAMRKTGKSMKVFMSKQLIELIWKILPEEFVFNKYGCDITLPNKIDKLTYIQRYSQQFPEHYIFAQLNDFVFESNQKRYEKVQSLTTKWNLDLKKLCGFISLTPISSHVMRHTYATMMLASKVDIRLISEALGHANLNVTVRYIKSLGTEQVGIASVDFYDSLDNPYNNPSVDSEKNSTNS